jgi:hypothetical protein
VRRSGGFVVAQSFCAGEAERRPRLGVFGWRRGGDGAQGGATGFKKGKPGISGGIRARGSPGIAAVSVARASEGDGEDRADEGGPGVSGGASTGGMGRLGLAEALLARCGPKRRGALRGLGAGHGPSWAGKRFAGLSGKEGGGLELGFGAGASGSGPG